jgi:hypothetical protein
MEDQDQTCKCKDCSAEFVFTVGEKRFYESNGFQPPKRCKECRNKRKAQRDGGPSREGEPQNNRTNQKGGRRDDRDERY